MLMMLTSFEHSIQFLQARHFHDDLFVVPGARRIQSRLESCSHTVVHLGSIDRINIQFMYVVARNEAVARSLKSCVRSRTWKQQVLHHPGGGLTHIHNRFVHTIGMIFSTRLLTV